MLQMAMQSVRVLAFMLRAKTSGGGPGGLGRVAPRRRGDNAQDEADAHIVNDTENVMFKK